MVTSASPSVRQLHIMLGMDGAIHPATAAICHPPATTKVPAMSTLGTRRAYRSWPIMSTAKSSAKANNGCGRSVMVSLVDVSKRISTAGGSTAGSGSIHCVVEFSKNIVKQVRKLSIEYCNDHCRYNRSQNAIFQRGNTVFFTPKLQNLLFHDASLQWDLVTWKAVACHRGACSRKQTAARRIVD